MKFKLAFYLGLAIAALVAVACSPAATPTTEPTAPPPTTTPVPTATLTPSPPTSTPTTASPAASSEESEDPIFGEGEVPMGFTEEGAPYRGNPDAPVTLMEFSEFQCPYCGRHTLQTGPLLYKAYIATGKVKHVFLQCPLDSIHPRARQAAEASLCAAQQGAEAFWAMHDRLFKTAQEWSGQEDPSEYFIGYAEELGLDGEAFAACLESRETAAQVQAELELSQAMGIRGVPAFYINDWFISGARPFEDFQQTIEAALRGEHPLPTPTPLPPGVTLFDPNPERPGYTYGGDAFYGSEEAEVSLVEFIDLHSPENREHFLKVWPELKEQYVEPGEVRLIVKHFPASDSPQAFKAAEAVECAGRQGAFWEFHDVLFQRQEEWAQADDAPAILKGYAAELGLDDRAFAVCLDEDQTEDKVKRDLEIAQRNRFPPAPQAFIFKGQQGGYVPLDRLQEAIEQLLAQ